MSEPFDIKVVVRQARLHHILDIVSGLYWLPCTAYWEGDRDAGRYFWDNGSGDHMVIGWELGELVAVFFNHEDSERSEYEVDEDFREGLANLELPDELEKLGADCAELSFQLITAGMWIVGDDCGTSDPWDADSYWNHGLEMLWGFERSPEEAVFADGAGWVEDFSLSPAHALLCIDLALADGPVTLTADQMALLAIHPGEDREVEEDQWPSTIEALGVLEISVPG